MNVEPLEVRGVEVWIWVVGGRAEAGTAMGLGGDDGGGAGDTGGGRLETNVMSSDARNVRSSSEPSSTVVARNFVHCVCRPVSSSLFLVEEEMENGNEAG